MSLWLRIKQEFGLCYSNKSGTCLYWSLSTFLSFGQTQFSASDGNVAAAAVHAWLRRSSAPTCSLTNWKEPISRQRPLKYLYKQENQSYCNEESADWGFLNQAIKDNGRVSSDEVFIAWRDSCFWYWCSKHKPLVFAHILYPKLEKNKEKQDHNIHKGADRFFFNIDTVQEISENYACSFPIGRIEQGRKTATLIWIQKTADCIASSGLWDPVCVQIMFPVDLAETTQQSGIFCR